MLIDDREKTPWLFKEHTSSRTRLKVGDYTLRGYKPYLAVERKSWMDFVNCISSSWNKFFTNKLSQVNRLLQLDYACIIVEGNVFSHSHRRHPNLGDIDPLFIADRVSEVSLWLPICFYGNRLTAQHGCLSFLRHGKEALDDC